MASLGLMMTSACARNEIQDARLTNPAAVTSTGGSDPSSAPSSDANGTTTSTPTNIALSIVQGGSGWQGDVNVAATSKDYLAYSLDDLEKMGSPMIDELKKHPDVEAAIRQVSTQTGVPAGLLAGICYQESSFDNTSYSSNPNPSSQDSADVGITQAPIEDFTGTTWQDPVANLNDFIIKQGFLSGYQKYKSWGYVLRLWNSGEVPDPNNLAKEQGNTDPNYLTEILGTHCMGKD